MRGGSAGASTEAGRGTRNASGTRPAVDPPQAERHDVVQHWQSALRWLCPGSCWPTAAALVVHKTIVPPEARVAA